jgi:regulator of replication initiation timing
MEDKEQLIKKIDRLESEISYLRNSAKDNQRQKIYGLVSEPRFLRIELRDFFDEKKPHDLPMEVNELLTNIYEIIK